METIIPEVAKQSPLLAVAIMALLIVFKLAEQKVAMAQRQAEREKEIACQSMEQTKDGRLREDTLVKTIRDNMETMGKLVNAIDKLSGAVDRSLASQRTKSKAPQ